MAVVSSKPFLAAACATIVLLLLAAAAVPGSASTIVFFADVGCSGQSYNFWVTDDCHNIRLSGGLSFYSTPGVAAYLFDATNCGGSPSAIIRNATWRCNEVTQKSVKLVYEGCPR